MIKALLLSATFLFACGVSAQQNPQECRCPTLGSDMQQGGVHDAYSLLSESEVKDLFGTRVSKSYYIIQLVLSTRSPGQDGPSFAIRNLSVHFPGKIYSSPTSSTIVLAQIPGRYRIRAADLLKQEFLIPSNSTVVALLVFGKGRLSLPDGKLPNGTWFFGEIRKTDFQVQPFQSMP